MSDTTSLDSILSDEKSVHDLPESEADVSEPVGEEARETQATEPEASTQAPAMGDADDEVADPDPVDLSAKGLRKALTAERGLKRDERKQRRELQRQLDQLRGELNAMRQMPQVQQAQPQQQPKSEDEFAQFLERGPEYVKGQIEQRVESIRTQAIIERIEDAETAFAEQHEDAPAAFAKFRELAASDPALQMQFRAVVDRKHPAYRNPAKFAYQYVKAWEAANEIGDPDAWREAERAKLLAEIQGQSGQPLKPPAKAPSKTLVDVRGSGVGATTQWQGSPSLESILKQPPRRAIV